MEGDPMNYKTGRRPIAKFNAITLHKDYWWWTRCRASEKAEIEIAVDRLRQPGETDTQVIMRALETVIALEVV